MRVMLTSMMAIAMLLTLGAGQALADEGGFAVTPLRVDLDIDPGGQKKTTIEVVNTQSKTLTFKVSFEDFEGSSSDPYAAPVLLDGVVDSPISGATWLSTGSSSFKLKPGATKNVTITSKAPSSASGGHYAAAIISTGTKSISSNLNVQSRVGVLFMMNAGGVGPPEIVFDEVYINEGGDTVIEFTNDGDTAAQPDPSVDFTNPITGEDLGSLDGECSEALPGASGECVIDGSTPAGADDSIFTGDPSTLVYSGEVALSNGGREFTQEMPAQVEGGIKSLLLPLAGIGLFVGYFFFMRRRNAEDDEELMLAEQ